MPQPQDERPRLFVAIELTEEVLQALVAVQAELRRRDLNGLRWVRPEGIHLTLKFLGETPSGRLPAIRQALGKAVAGVPPHSLSLDGLGAFGGRQSPRVLWIDLKGDIETLVRLQEQVDRALAQEGFPRETRPFSPHLTLARVRPETARDVAGPLADAIRAVNVNIPQAAMEAREVSLMRSKLGPGGAVYTRLDAFPLG